MIRYATPKLCYDGVKHLRSGVLLNGNDILLPLALANGQNGTH